MDSENRVITVTVDENELKLLNFISKNKIKFEELETYLKEKDKKIDYPTALKIFLDQLTVSRGVIRTHGYDAVTNKDTIRYHCEELYDITNKVVAPEIELLVTKSKQY